MRGTQQSLYMLRFLLLTDNYGILFLNTYTLMKLETAFMVPRSKFQKFFFSLYYIHYPLQPGTEKEAWTNEIISLGEGEVGTLRPKRQNGQNVLILSMVVSGKKILKELTEDPSEIFLPRLIDIVQESWFSFSFVVLKLFCRRSSLKESRKRKPKEQSKTSRCKLVSFCLYQQVCPNDTYSLFYL